VTPTDQITGIFAANGRDTYFGERVSQREHALQTAALAERAGSRPSLVIAALLHDIGHLLHGLGENIAEEGIDTRHQEAGGKWLSRRFGPEITEPVRLHVDAKRYLCFREPEYRKALSPSSKRSLELQGGAFSEREAADFEKNRYFREAVAIRRWDDAAKVPDLAVPDLDHYAALISSCQI
jgi:phosphonate degradation associated HDIG domain protein